MTWSGPLSLSSEFISTICATILLRLSRSFCLSISVSIVSEVFIVFSLCCVFPWLFLPSLLVSFFWNYLHWASPFYGASLISLITNLLNSFSGKWGISSWFGSIAGELVRFFGGCWRALLYHITRVGFLVPSYLGRLCQREGLGVKAVLLRIVYSCP